MSKILMKICIAFGLEGFVVLINRDLITLELPCICLSKRDLIS